MKTLLFALLLFTQDDQYREAMEAGQDALQRKKYAEAAQEFSNALRQKPNDPAALKGFGLAIRELEIYNTRYGDLRVETVKKFGMEKALPAIERGLAWLAKRQQEDGRWKCKPMQGATDDMATTSFALLALLADGNSETTGAHREVVAKGVAWLLKRQQADGGFGGARLYTEGLCVLAMVEAFVMGGREAHYIAAQKGIEYIVKCQRPEGGWNYRGSEDGWGDTSVTGMMFQPLKQGQMAYLDFDEKCLERGRRFVERMTDSDHWVRYRQHDARHSLPVTAIGNLVRLYAGSELDEGGLKLVLDQAEVMKKNLYFLYYGAMLAFLAGGDAWTKWRDDMLPHLLGAQREDGSWKPEGAGVEHGYADYLSDVDATAMALLSLEVSHRYVPRKMLK